MSSTQKKISNRDFRGINYWPLDSNGTESCNRNNGKLENYPLFQLGFAEKPRIDRKTEISDAYWDAKFQKIFETKDIHSYFEHFNLIIQEIVNKFLPEKIKTPGQNKNWVDNQFKNLSNKKHLLYKHYKIDCSLEIWERYCAAKRRLRKIVDKKKQLQFQTLISAESNSNKKYFFKTINLLIGKKFGSKPNLTVEQCHEFKQFFTSVAEEMNEKCNGN